MIISPLQLMVCILPSRLLLVNFNGGLHLIGGCSKIAGKIFYEAKK